MTTPNFNVEGKRTESLKSANALTVGSKFTFVYDVLTVVSFLKERIVTVDQNGKKVYFGDFEFAGYFNNGEIKIN